LYKILNENDLLEFIVEKKAFNEKFVKLVCESNELTKMSNIIDNNNIKNLKVGDYLFDITKVDYDYELGYDKKKKKVTVDISNNSIFSYYDSESDLQKRLDNYIENEEYENANIIYNFLTECKN
jgi:hypothetical protein